MSSINQLISEIAHAVGQPNNVPLRRNIKYAILHTRNELIRRSFENNRYLDKGLQQRVKLSLIDVPDGDFHNSAEYMIKPIKRTAQKVPRPVRLTNNLPFQSVRTAGYDNHELPFAKEASAKFYTHLVGMCNLPCWDYINEYIYFFTKDNTAVWFNAVNAIVVESVFEAPHLIEIETHESKKDTSGYNIDTDDMFDDDEFLLPEDMVGAIKDIIFKRNLLQVPRETNEVPTDNLLNR